MPAFRAIRNAPDTPCAASQRTKYYNRVSRRAHACLFETKKRLPCRERGWSYRRGCIVQSVRERSRRAFLSQSA